MLAVLAANILWNKAAFCIRLYSRPNGRIRVSQKHSAFSVRFAVNAVGTPGMNQIDFIIN